MNERSWLSSRAAEGPGRRRLPPLRPAVERLSSGSGTAGADCREQHATARHGARWPRSRRDLSRARPRPAVRNGTGQDMARCTVPTVRACPVCVRVPPPRCMARGWLSRSLHGDLHDLHFCSAPVPSGPGRNVLGQHILLLLPCNEF